MGHSIGPTATSDYPTDILSFIKFPTARLKPKNAEKIRNFKPETFSGARAITRNNATRARRVKRRPCKRSTLAYAVNFSRNHLLLNIRSVLFKDYRHKAM